MEKSNNIDDLERNNNNSETDSEDDDDDDTIAAMEAILATPFTPLAKSSSLQKEEGKENAQVDENYRARLASLWSTQQKDAPEVVVCERGYYAVAFADHPVVLAACTIHGNVYGCAQSPFSTGYYCALDSDAQSDPLVLQDVAVIGEHSFDMETSSLLPSHIVPLHAALQTQSLLGLEDWIERHLSYWCCLLGNPRHVATFAQLLSVWLYPCFHATRRCLYVPDNLIFANLSSEAIRCLRPTLMHLQGDEQMSPLQVKWRTKSAADLVADGDLVLKQRRLTWDPSVLPNEETIIIDDVIIDMNTDTKQLELEYGALVCLGGLLQAGRGPDGLTRLPPSMPLGGGGHNAWKVAQREALEKLAEQCTAVTLVSSRCPAS
jgi:hypothetical protein